jgi:hypothetical protein
MTNVPFFEVLGIITMSSIGVSIDSKELKTCGNVACFSITLPEKHKEIRRDTMSFFVQKNRLNTCKLTL